MFSLGLISGCMVVAGLAALIGSIEWSGCFIDRFADPNHATGGGLFALALGLFLTGPLLTWVAWRKVRTVRTAGILIGLVALPSMMATGPLGILGI